MSAVQLEHPMERVRETEAERRADAAAPTDALVALFPAHFGRPPAEVPRRASAPQSK